MILLALILGLGFGWQSGPMFQQEDVPSVEEILNRMEAHEEWQQRYLIEYQAQRKFTVTNPKLKEDATLEVRTSFHRPDTIESQVLRAEGSKFIRERVFDKILEAENETQSLAAKQQSDIGLANYSFSYLGREDCAGRECYRLRITPKRKEKYLINGQIWIDAEDAGIMRIQGSPAKRPSFWTRQTQIDRRYKRVDGMWLSGSLESTSDILVAGHSTLKIQYSYESIQVDPQYGSRGNSVSLVTSPSVLRIQPVPYVKKCAPPPSLPGIECTVWPMVRPVAASR